ncbi:MAG: MCP four helix bundle domain-containing protein [Anaerolineae bacterium]|nr:MCP four helix bundle domain-containing protein [Gemmatimonadaceae bacterium]
MNWTVSKRISTGFGLILALLLIVAASGIIALQRVTRSYEDVLHLRNISVVPALQLDAHIRAANESFLRFLVGNDERFLPAYDSALAQARGYAEQLRDSSTVDEAQRGWSEVLTQLGQWGVATRMSTAARRAGNEEEASRIRATQVQPMGSQLYDEIRENIESTIRQSNVKALDGRNSSERAQVLLSIGAIIALLSGILAAVVLARSINRPLRESTSVLATSAAEILAATTQQAAGANQSMAAVTQTVATVDEVAQTAHQASQRAASVASSAQRAADMGMQGKKAVQDSVAAMRGVKEQVESVAESIVALAEQATAIGEIITSVNEIAEQTNLLALNAAVESARAGEQGRGFAVVASEIKSLAEQAKRSTVQVRQMLGDIQRATSAAVMTTEQGTKQVTAAARQVTQAGETIGGLVDAISESAQSAAQIVASAGQQAIGMEQIRQAISSIQQATQQNLASTRQSEIAAQELDRIGSGLVDLVGGKVRRA